MSFSKFGSITIGASLMAAVAIAPSCSSENSSAYQPPRHDSTSQALVQPLEVAIDPTQEYQLWEGFGTSLAWWANIIGKKDTKLRDALVELITNPETGLGYNVFRYNIGGGDNPEHNHMREGGDIQGFQPEPNVWDWNADAAQRSVLEALIAKVDDNIILEAFSNSPPYWMTKSGCASGHETGENNLKEDYYDDFADYLTEVVLHFKDEWNIVFHSLEPMNEPDATWWRSNGTQEGCRFRSDKQRELILQVAQKLKEKGLDEVILSAADYNSMRWAIGDMTDAEGYDGYSQETWDALEQINVHSYHDLEFREQVFDLAQTRSKRLWMSESGPLAWTRPTPHETGEMGMSLDAALYMAGVIIDDLRKLKPTAWVDWQTFDPALAWTSFFVDEHNNEVRPSKRFYMHAQFSRFIRPGATLVHIAYDNAVAAVSMDGKALAIVLRNDDKSEEKSFVFNLDLFEKLGPSASVYRTSRTEELLKLDDIPIENGRIAYSAPSYSVTTLVVTLLSEPEPEPEPGGGCNSVAGTQFFLLAASVVFGFRRRRLLTTKKDDKRSRSTSGRL